MYQGKDETRYATLIPYDYRPPFIIPRASGLVLKPGTIFVDKDNPSPDPGKRMLWGFDADGQFGPGDFKKFFKRRAGLPIEVPYQVNSMDTAHQVQVKKGAAIRSFLAIYRERGGAERAIQPEVGRDRSSLLIRGAEKPGSSSFAMKPGTWTTTSDGRKVLVIYAGPWSWRAKSESRVAVLYWPVKDEYSTHEQSMGDMAFYSGHYFTSLSSALEDFEERTGIRPPEEVFRTKGLPG
jgi:hypothetical protein